MRPFTNMAVKEYLAQDGDLLFLWMDKIKSYCFVTVRISNLPTPLPFDPAEGSPFSSSHLQYDSAAVAAQAKARIHGTIWPDVTGKVLNVEYSTESQAQKVIQTTDGLQLVQHGNREPQSHPAAVDSQQQQQPQRPQAASSSSSSSSSAPKIEKEISIEFSTEAEGMSSFFQVIIYFRGVLTVLTALQRLQRESPRRISTTSSKRPRPSRRSTTSP